MTSRASETVRPFLISRWACACLAGVIRFTVPSWSSWPQRPPLFRSLKYPSTRSWVGRAASAIGRVLSRSLAPAGDAEAQGRRCEEQEDHGRPEPVHVHPHDGEEHPDREGGPAAPARGAGMAERTGEQATEERPDD